MYLIGSYIPLSVNPFYSHSENVRADTIDYNLARINIQSLLGKQTTRCGW
ncbi:hypothetical protein SAMN05216361_2910 [Marisediminitalea aggregata]|uniref:Uncharacterized protein n=1 Tax=Marisediminitalea aggregata TaxID=634436 RepID=A0A1M5M5Q0_9ALTE|nr:hypothetical protein SAMN05216361_2910 [Marisediminitalea aggregata]